MSLLEAVRTTHCLRERVRRRPLGFIRWLPNQDRWLHDPHPYKACRQGNQWGGKSTAAVQELDWRCQGTHPHYPTRAPPVHFWVICASWAQSLAFQSKLWHLVDRDVVDLELTSFSKKTGFRGQPKVFVYKNGSTITIKTAGQDAIDLSSAPITGGIVIDEPCAERIDTEAWRRVSKTGGVILYSLTPINGPVDHLRKKCEAGLVHDHHARLEAHELIPVGATQPIRTDTGQLMDEEYIAFQRLITPADEAPVVLDGEWETKQKRRSLAAFTDACVVPHTVRGGWASDTPVHVLLSADHGEAAYHQAWLVIAFQAFREPGPGGGYDAYQARVIGVYQNPPNSSRMEHVEAIDHELRELGLRLTHVDFAVGDHNTEGNSKGARSLNEAYTEAFAEQMGLPAEHPSFTVEPARKGRHSVDYGLKVLNNGLRRHHLEVSERCAALVTAANRWQGTKRGKDQDYVHLIDAWRYGIVEIEAIVEGLGRELAAGW
ncbi:MAG: hypothetical protein GY925_26330 [Actinomycetia bacterium]|nr:hypothetical protein [Actinomycetes bacterium]